LVLSAFFVDAMLLVIWSKSLITTGKDIPIRHHRGRGAEPSPGNYH
jgi:hypothetical protein